MLVYHVAGSDRITNMNTDAAASSPAALAAAPACMPLPAPLGPPSGTPAMPPVTPLPNPVSWTLSPYFHPEGVAGLEPQQPVCILVWNVRGLSEVRSAQLEKWQYITILDNSYVNRNPVASPFWLTASGHTVSTIPATSLGRAGEGVLLAVWKQLPLTVSL